MKQRQLIVGAGLGVAVAAVALPAYAYVEQSIETSATLTAATLGTPSTTVQLKGADATITPKAPAEGPTPTSYAVATLDATGKKHVVCPKVTTDPCTDVAPTSATERKYVVTAQLGDHWVRDSEVVSAFTAPPMPALALKDGGAAAAQPGVVLSAPAGGEDYSLAVYVDGAAQDIHHETIPGGTPANVSVDLPQLAVGKHSVTATAQFHEAKTPSTALELTVAASGTITATTPPATDDTTSTDPVPSGDPQQPATLTDVDHDGTIGTGDTATLTRATVFDAQTLCGSWPTVTAPGETPHVTVTVDLPDLTSSTAKVNARPAAGTCATADAATLDLGTVAVAGRLATDGVVFSDSRLAVDADGKILTLTLGTSVPAPASTPVPTPTPALAPNTPDAPADQPSAPGTTSPQTTTPTSPAAQPAQVEPPSAVTSRATSGPAPTASETTAQTPTTVEHSPRDRDAEKPAVDVR